MCYVWLANMAFMLARDWIGWARGLFATTLRVHRHNQEQTPTNAVSATQGAISRIA